MEKIIPLEKIGKSPQTYKNVIKKERLPLYEEAAKKTGYGVEVTAREGTEISVEDQEKGILTGTFRKIKVSPGYVEVAVTLPPGQEKVGTTPFYEAVRELEQPPK